MNIILRFSSYEAEGPSDPREQKRIYPKIATRRGRLFDDLLDKQPRNYMQSTGTIQSSHNKRI